MESNKAQEIEAVVKALAMMIDEPQFESNPEEIGKKQFVGVIRKPILEADNRKIVIEKLVKMIDSITV